MKQPSPELLIMQTLLQDLVRMQDKHSEEISKLKGFYLLSDTVDSLENVVNNITQIQDQQALQIKKLFGKVDELEKQIELLMTYVNPEGFDIKF